MGNGLSFLGVSQPASHKKRPSSKRKLVAQTSDSSLVTREKLPRRVRSSAADDTHESDQHPFRLALSQSSPRTSFVLPISPSPSSFDAPSRLPPPPPTLAAAAAAAARRPLDASTETAYKAFLKSYPEYKLTWILDALRTNEFARLDRNGQTYVDYMGGALYPESLVHIHADFLRHSILGNTHSVSLSSQLSTDCAQEAREAVLAFFRAPPEYTVVFTANASGALKLVGEAFPFTAQSRFVLGADSHNSVHGIREYASRAGAHVAYVASTPQGGFDLATAKTILHNNRPDTSSDTSEPSAPCLFALTGQSNISNSKTPLSTLAYASSLGYHTLLDAAALAPTSVVSLAEHPVDAMAVSFYKMFGFPTGVGALVAKRSFLARLRRPWFAGGTVDVVQVPGSLVTRAPVLHEQFEDGTINYLCLPAVTEGLRLLATYQPFLPLRLSCLTDFLIKSLLRLRHDEAPSTGGQPGPVARVLSRRPTKKLRTVGEQSDVGSTISLLFLDPSGEMIPNSFVEYAASVHAISLRTGCMCNPGGAAALLGLEADMAQLHEVASGMESVTVRAWEQRLGRELGVVRISLGLASAFEDAWKVVRLAATLACGTSRRALWERWERHQRQQQEEASRPSSLDGEEDGFSESSAAVPGL